MPGFSGPARRHHRSHDTTPAAATTDRRRTNTTILRTARNAHHSPANSTFRPIGSEITCRTLPALIHFIVVTGRPDAVNRYSARLADALECTRLFDGERIERRGASGTWAAAA